MNNHMGRGRITKKYKTYQVVLELSTKKVILVKGQYIAYMPLLF